MFNRRYIFAFLLTLVLACCSDPSSSPGDGHGNDPPDIPVITEPVDKAVICGHGFEISIRGLRPGRDSAVEVYNRGQLVHLVPRVGGDISLSSYFVLPGEEDDTLILDFSVLHYGGESQWIGSKTVYRHIPLHLTLEARSREGWRYDTDANGLADPSTGRRLKHIFSEPGMEIGGRADCLLLVRESEDDTDTAYALVENSSNLALYRPLKFLLRGILRLIDEQGLHWDLNEGKATGWLTVAQFVSADGCPMPGDLWPSVIRKTDGAALTVSTPNGVQKTYSITARGAVRNSSARLGAQNGSHRAYQYDVEIRFDDGSNVQLCTWTFWFSSVHSCILRAIRHPMTLDFAGMPYAVHGTADYIDP